MLIGEYALLIAAKYELTLDDLKSDNKTRRVVWPRQELMFLLYQTGKFSLPQIGKFLNHDHTTVYYGIQQYKKRTAFGITYTPKKLQLRPIPLIKAAYCD